MELLKSIYKKQYDLIATPCLVEGESYAIRSRKLGVIFLSLICANAFLGIPVNIAVVFQDYNLGSYHSSLHAAPPGDLYEYYPVFILAENEAPLTVDGGFSALVFTSGINLHDRSVP